MEGQNSGRARRGRQVARSQGQWRSHRWWCAARQCGALGQGKVGWVWVAVGSKVAVLNHAQEREAAASAFSRVPGVSKGSPRGCR